MHILVFGWRTSEPQFEKVGRFRVGWPASRPVESVNFVFTFDLRLRSCRGSACHLLAYPRAEYFETFGEFILPYSNEIRMKVTVK